MGFRQQDDDFERMRQRIEAQARAAETESSAPPPDAANDDDEWNEDETGDEYRAMHTAKDRQDFLTFFNEKGQSDSHAYSYIRSVWVDNPDQLMLISMVDGITICIEGFRLAQVRRALLARRAYSLHIPYPDDTLPEGEKNSPPLITAIYMQDPSKDVPLQTPDSNT